MADVVGTWYLIKYIADLERREPINVGVAFKYDDGWHTKFIGQDSDGTVAGRLPRTMPRDSYLEWVDYFQRKAASDDFRAAIAHQQRRAVNYYVEPGGQVVSPMDFPDVDDLFGRLVKQAKPTRHGMDALRDAIDEIFARVKIEPAREVAVDGRWSKTSPIEPITFDYAYRNGEQHLMDALSTGAAAVKDALALNARFSAVLRAQAAQSFMVFYSKDATRGDIETTLRPVDEIARTIDVDDLDKATETVGGVLVH